jgi:organic hydroperoxide reductase OsmC/OhrA
MEQKNQSTSQPKVKHKSFTYHTGIKWEKGSRAGMLSSDGKDTFRVASPPEFKGEEGVWSPEDIFVGAIEACTLTTFVAFSMRLNLPVVSYQSSAEGLLEFHEGKYQFTKVYVRPEIVVETTDAVEQAKKTIHDAHQKCLISNSIRSEVILEPDIKVAGNNS